MTHITALSGSSSQPSRSVRRCPSANQVKLQYEDACAARVRQDARRSARHESRKDPSIAAIAAAGGQGSAARGAA